MSGRVIRYSFRERICHWLAGLSYTYSLLGGLALFSPHLYWIAAVLGGGPTTRFWHPIGGLVFLAAAIWMHAIWHRDMAITSADREWQRHLVDYMTNHDERVPPSGRFNAGQKQFYWAMFYGAIALFVSGLLVWFPEYVPQGAQWVRPLAILLHEAAALITIGAFIIHVYMGVFMVKGGVEGIVTGTVTREWAHEHHRKWYESIANDPAHVPTKE